MTDLVIKSWSAAAAADDEPSKDMRKRLRSGSAERARLLVLRFLGSVRGAKSLPRPLSSSSFMLLAPRTGERESAFMFGPPCGNREAMTPRRRGRGGEEGRPRWCSEGGLGGVWMWWWANIFCPLSARTVTMHGGLPPRLCGKKSDSWRSVRREDDKVHDGEPTIIDTVLSGGLG